MKIAIVSLITLMASSASAFAPASFTRGVSTQIYSDPEEEDGDGFDLNLEEMFDMFDAADKGEDFDEAVKAIKEEN